MKYVAPRWLPGGQLQTIWPALYSRRVFGPRPVYRRERWDTPDGDFVDVDFLLEEGATAPAALRPLLVVFHGLEGSSRSHYCEAFADWAQGHGAVARDGLGMLVEQAAEAFQLWRGVQPATSDVLHKLRAKL